MMGERLCELRKDAGMTQAELGELLSLSKFSISSYETGKTTPDDATKVRLAQIFNVSLDYLLGLIDEPAPLRRGEEVLVLPPALPKEARESIRKYIDFMKTTYGVD